VPVAALKERKRNETKERIRGLDGRLRGLILKTLTLLFCPKLLTLLGRD
jgi:hypothetical protein